jgi:HEAT repeat protein
VFVACLDRAKNSDARLLTGSHLLQVLWLDDERAVDFLIDLLDHKDRSVRSAALRLLNRLESGQAMTIPLPELPHQPAEYCRRRHETNFRETMTAAVREWNRAMKNGR